MPISGRCSLLYPLKSSKNLVKKPEKLLDFLIFLTKNFKKSCFRWLFRKQLFKGCQEKDKIIVD